MCARWVCVPKVHVRPDLGRHGLGQVELPRHVYLWEQNVQLSQHLIRSRARNRR